MAKRSTKRSDTNYTALDELVHMTEIVVDGREFSPCPIDTAHAIADGLREGRLQIEARMPAMDLPEHQRREICERRAWRDMLRDHAIAIRLAISVPKKADATWLKYGLVQTTTREWSRAAMDTVIEWNYACLFCKADLHTQGSKHGAHTKAHVSQRMQYHVDLCAMEYLIERGWE